MKTLIFLGVKNTKTIFHKLTKVLLLILFCCPFAFTQLTFIKSPSGQSYSYVVTNLLYMHIKEGSYNEELFRKLENPPYFPTYSIDKTVGTNINLKINGDVADINILDHISKLEKEEFVDWINTAILDILMSTDSVDATYGITGQVLQNGEPLTNHIVNLFDNNSGVVWNSITDEGGNYVFYRVWLSAGSHTVSTKIGNIRYDTTLIVEKKQDKYPPLLTKIINFNDGRSYIVGTDEPEELPTEYSLLQNYPNPFNPTTTIQYSIPNDEFVKLTIYDITGRVVKELVNGYKTAGKYNIEFNANSYSSGTYYYKLEAGEYKNIQKMMLIK